MDVELAKGVRDFPPEDKILRERIVATLKSIFERYGYNPLETPLIERYETLAAKFGAGEGSDAMKETFKLKDQGDRDLGLRFELTLSLARFIALNQRVKMPFKRYEIGQVFRDGPIKLGRYRQFWQCDVDVVGNKSMRADAELIQLAFDAFKEMGLDAYLVFSNRKLINGVMTQIGISNPKEVMITIDKIKKVSKADFEKELRERGMDASQISEIYRFFDIKGSNQEKADQLRTMLTDEEAKLGLTEIEEVLQIINREDLVFDISLVRGLGYYTGTIFEGFMKKSKVTSSICGGGRYDNMIGGFLGRDIPAVGISFGLEPITDIFRLQGFDSKSVVQLYVIPIGTFKEAFALATRLRQQGIKLDIDTLEKGVGKAMDFANAYSIPYVLFVGADELKAGTYKLKDMKSGKEEMLSEEAIVKRLSV